MREPFGVSGARSSGGMYRLSSLQGARRFDVDRIKGDGYGALIGAVATLPQAFAYGLIAFAPLGADWAAFGIASSIGSCLFAGLFCAVFGSNPLFVSGPRAVSALVVATSISAALSRGYAPEVAIALAFSGVALSGLFSILAGALRIGGIISFMPLPVLSGFATASALLVCFSSLPTALGITGIEPSALLDGAWQDASLWAIAVSSGTAVVNLATEGRLRLFPPALAGMTVGTALYLVGIATGQPAGPTIGTIDLVDMFVITDPASVLAGFATLSRDFDIPLLAGLSIGLLTGFDTIFGGAALESDSRHKAKPNRDLIVQGLANAAAGLFGFLPASGTYFRSMALIRAGATTRMATIGCTILFIAMLTVLSPVFSAVPLWSTAGMLIATAILAVDTDTLRKAKAILVGTLPYRRIVAGDVAVTLIVVIVAVVFDLIAAVGAGIVLAVLLFVIGLGRDPVRRVYTCGRIHSSVMRTPEEIAFLETEGHKIAVVELRGTLFFGSQSSLIARVDRLIDSGVRYVILDFRHLTSIDSTGAEAIRTIERRCREGGGALLLSRVEPERRRVSPSTKARSGEEEDRRRGAVGSPRWVWLTLSSAGLLRAVGAERIADNADAAMAYCEDCLFEKAGDIGTGASPRRMQIGDNALLKGLSRNQILALAPYFTRRAFQVGESVFNQGDPGDEAFLLVRGRMDVTIAIPGSIRRRRLTLMTDGALFGELALLDGGNRSATVTAVERSICFSIDRPAFSKMERDHPALALVLLENLNRLISDRLRIANTMISELEQ